MFDHERFEKSLKHEGVIRDQHMFIPKAGCTRTYIDKERLAGNPALVDSAGLAIARMLGENPVDTVIGVGTMNAVLAHATALHLQTTSQMHVRVAHADPAPKHLEFIGSANDSIRGRRVVIVHTVLTTGDAVNRLIRAVVAKHGTVAGVVPIWHRGIRGGFADIPFLPLFPEPLETVSKASCEICKERASSLPTAATG